MYRHMEFWYKPGNVVTSEPVNNTHSSKPQHTITVQKIKR